MSGRVQPDLWMICVAAQIPHLTATSSGLPCTYCARKPPTKASPAPFVSTILNKLYYISGYAPKRPLGALKEGNKDFSSPTLNCSFKRKRIFFCRRRDFFLGVISLRRVVVPSPKYIQTFPGPMRSYNVQENHIGSVVSEIIRYKQTDTYTLILVLLFLKLVFFCSEQKYLPAILLKVIDTFHK